MKRRRISKQTFSALLVLIVWTTIALTHVIVLLGAAQAGTNSPSDRTRTSFAATTPASSAKKLEPGAEGLQKIRKSADPNVIPVSENDLTEPSASPAI